MAATLQWEVGLGELPEPTEADFIPWPEDVAGGTVEASPRPVIRRGGIALPYRFGGNGDLVMTYDLEAIRQSIQALLGIKGATPTSRGEVRWDPARGSVLDRIRHMVDAPATLELARYYVVRTLTIYEPGILVRSAVVTGEYDESTGGVILRVRLVYDVPALGAMDVVQLEEL